MNMFRLKDEHVYTETCLTLRHANYTVHGQAGEHGRHGRPLLLRVEDGGPVRNHVRRLPGDDRRRNALPLAGETPTIVPLEYM